MNPRVVEHVSTADTEYGVVLLDERSGKYWLLTPTASLVVTELKRGGGVDTAVAALTSGFDVDEQTARADTLALIDQLRSLGVVTT